MVGIVVVSHSSDLARAAVDLALQMAPVSPPRIEIAPGTSDNRLGTDASRVAEAIVAADDGDGVAVIMDLGSAVLSAELALELLPEPHETRLSQRHSPKASLRRSSLRPRALSSMSLLGMPPRLSRQKPRSLIRTCRR